MDWPQKALGPDSKEIHQAFYVQVSGVYAFFQSQKSGLCTTDGRRYPLRSGFDIALSAGSKIVSLCPDV